MILYDKNKKTKNIVSMLAVLTLAVLGFAFSANNAFAVLSGTFTSSIKDTTASNYWGNIVFNTTLNGGTITMKVRTSNSATMVGAPAFSTCNDITSGTNITGNNCVTSPARYVQYQATLTFGTSSPSLDDVTIYYGGYAPSATLTSSAYNTGQAYNVLSKLTWNEGTLPANTDIKFQIKTAPDSGSNTPGTWTAWCGPDNATSGTCNSAAFFTAPTGAETIDDINRDGYLNQWIQYKVWLTSTDGVSTPTLSGVSAEYVINTAPVIASVTASQGADGIISIGYNISDVEQTSVNVSLLADIGVTLNEVLANSTDPGGGAVTVSDATLLPASGAIQIENEQITYTGKSGNDLTGATRAANSSKYAGHASATVVWIKGTTVSGNAGTVTGITSTPAAKTATWTIKTDLAGVYRNVTTSPAKIRVSANDSQVGNPTGTGDSASFTLDTKNPTGATPVIVNSTTSSPSANLTISVTDDSTKYMRFANAANQTTPDCATDLYNKTEGQVAYASYAASYAFYSLSPDANGVSTVCYEFKDPYANKLQGSASTPQTPVNTKLNDISSPPTSKYKLLAWWDAVSDPGSFTGYNVYRSADGTTYTLLSTIANRLTNYCFDGDADGASGTCADDGTGALTSTTAYYYKITAQDADGISAYSSASSPVSAIPNGTTTGEVDTAAPTLSSGPSPVGGADSGSSSSATVTWTTNENSYSLVRYGKTTSLGSITGSATESVTSHSVALSGLDSGTLYYYQILSADPSGNLLQSPATPPTGLYTFTTTSDTTAPTISSGPTVSTDRNSATISWVTNEASTTQVKYIEAVGGSTSTNPAGVGGSTTTLQSEKVTNHYVVITGLTANTTYNYQIISSDASSNTLTSPSSSPYLQFTTSTAKSDNTAPSITVAPAASSITLTSAAIGWTTDEASYSLVEYGLTDSFGSIKGAVSDSVTSHSVSLTGLSSGTTYSYRAHSADASGNLTTSSTSTFTTTSDTTAPTISSGPTVSTDRNSATISWVTNEASTTQVKYIPRVDNSTDPATGTATTLQTEKVTNHYVIITGLTANTAYNYQVISTDAASNTLTSPSVSPFSSQFTTSTAKLDNTAPSITVAPAATSITLTSAAIGWTTDEASYSLVEYGLTDSFGSIKGTVSDSVTSHSVSLTGLSSGTTYSYRAHSADASGNLTTSSTSTFTTTSDTTAPTISSGPTVSTDRNSATISWVTNEASTTQVKYIAAAGGSTSTVPTTATTLQTEKVTNHYVVITGLTADTAYNYQIISADAAGNTLTSPSISPFSQFTTSTAKLDNTAPSITAVTATPSPSDATQATITWTTAGESSYSLVEYGLTSSFGIIKGTVLDADYTTTHSVVLSGLNPGTTYSYKTHSADSSGNRASSSVSTFTTADLAVSSVSASSSRSSALVTWSTNGPANSKVKYKMSSSDLSSGATTTSLSQTEGATSHIVSLENLTQDKTYYYQAISTDGRGNQVSSSVSSFETTSGTKPVITAGAATPSDTSATVAFSAASNNSTPLFLSIEYATLANFSNSKESATPSAATSGATGAVTLEGLASNTKYYYKLKARDAFGNTQTSTSDSYNFTTISDTAAPVMTFDSTANVTVTSISAVVTWTTDEKATARVDYGLTNSYGSNAANSNPNINQSITLSGLNPSTTYYYKLTSVDASVTPNTSSRTKVNSDNTGADLSFTTPIQLDTTPPVIPSVTAGTPSATTVTITWTTDKNSSSLIDFGATTAYGTTQGNSADSTKNHSVTLVGLSPAAKYYIRAKSVDSSGNVATKASDSSGQDYSFTTASSTAGDPPNISSVGVQAGSITSSSAVINWTTSVNADSTVGYSSAPDKNYTFESGNSSQLTSHSVTLTNLTPLTTYYYRVKSRNGQQLAASSSDTNGDFSFTTSAGADTVPPVISNVQVTSVTATKAAITWTTNENANSYIEFGLALGSYASVQGTPSESVLSHSVELTALTPNTTYYFQARSSDAAGNKVVDNNNGSGHSFSTTSGSSTNCPSASRVTTAACPSCLTCQAADITAPKISDVKVKDIAFSSAVIAWATDKESNSMVQYDTVSYGIKQGYANSSGKIKDSAKFHAVTLTNLDSNTTYYFRVSSADSRGNTAESEGQSFKTIAIAEAKDKGEAATVSLKKQFEDIAQTLVKDNLATEENIKDIISRIANPPIIGQEGPVVKEVKSYGATIVWQTDRKANSVVKFKAASSPTEALAAGNNWREIGKMDTYDTAHEVEILGLAPNTTYAYQAKSQDVLGNTTSSDLKTFTTSSSSSIFNVNVTDITLNSAKINWETANLSTSLVEYGLTFAYGNQANKGDEKVKTHGVELSNLTSGTTYHFRIRSVEESGNILSTEDYTFATYQLPQITKYDLGEVKDNSIELKWTSNIPVDSNIRYTDKDTGETKIVGAPEKSLEHSVVLSELSAGKAYKIEIQGRDEAGNLAELPAFETQTGIDTVPPEIVQVRSQAAILSGAEDKVQAIISWKTNELSTSQVLWDLGTTKGDTFANATKADSNLTTNHISVITNFKPGTVYRFRVASSDKFGNISVSPDYSILTPVRRQSVVQMIMSNFEKIFGWTKNLGR